MAVLRDLRNKQTYTETVTIPSDVNALLAGPDTIPTLVVDGNLNVIGEIDITNTLTIGSSGKINLVG